VSAGPRGALVRWYRPDQSAAVVRALAAAIALVLVGSFIFAGVFYAGERATGVLRVLPGVVGVLTTVAGPLCAIVGLRRALFHDVYLALHTDGVVWNDVAERWFVYWDDLARVRYDAGEGVVLLERRGHDGAASLRVREKMYGCSREELARVLDEARRKAGFGLLAPGPP
jgi:hypothetical protein